MPTPTNDDEELLANITPDERNTPTFDKFRAFMCEGFDGDDMFTVIRDHIPETGSHYNLHKLVVALMFSAFEAGEDTADD